MPKVIKTGSELKSTAEQSIITKSLISKIRTNWTVMEDPDLENHILCEDNAGSINDLILYRNLGNYILSTENNIDSDLLKKFLESKGYVFNREFKDMMKINKKTSNDYFEQGTFGEIGNFVDGNDVHTAIIINYVDGPESAPVNFIVDLYTLDLICDNFEEIKYW